MGKRLVVLLSVLISFLVVLASAHPGRTDSNGGHYNRSTGVYHYHHGYPEHQHVDGECPYDFVDKTGQSSGSSSGGGGGGSYVKPKATPTPTPTPKPTPKPTPTPTPEPSFWKKTGIEIGDILGVSAAIVAVWLACSAFSIYKDVKSRKQKEAFRSEREAARLLEEQREAELQERIRIAKAQEEARLFEEERAKVIELYGGEKAREAAGVPDHIDFDSTDLPFIKGKQGWGPAFTVYTTAGGKAFHITKGCSGASVETHVFETAGRIPCQKCAKGYTLPSKPEWYFAYLKIKRIKKKYNVD